MQKQWTITEINTEEERLWLTELLSTSWGSPTVVSRNRVHQRDEIELELVI